MVASHPGNTNALKKGVHSPRFIEARTAEIINELVSSFDLPPEGLVAAHEVARNMAILEAIDRDLDERGIVGRGGKPTYLLEMRLRVSRLLDHWLAKLAPEMKRQRAVEEVASAGRDEYVRALRIIALRHDPDARVSDQVRALLALVTLDDPALNYESQRDFTVDAIEKEIARLTQEMEREKFGSGDSPA